MRKLLTIALIIFLPGCSSKNDDSSKENKSIKLTSQELDEVSENWKKDSLGCLRLRDYEKIKLLIDQRKLVGKDTLSVKQYLGRPNGKIDRDGKYTLVYFLECGEKGKVSYFNFYCHFEDNVLESYSGAVF